MRDGIDGVLVIDKPQGMTSARVVDKVKRALRVKRAGHTGTLDPMATGVLPLCLGEATKIAGYLLAEDKTYEAELELGVTTDTLDRDGQVLERAPEAAARVTEAALRALMAELVGPGEQVPPMYSALKHQGKRLHELARAGETVERAPRPIHIHALDLMAFEPPRARFRVHCSKGTYVRTLAADMGQRLGCGAHLTALRRTQSGMFTLAHALALTELTRERAAERLIDPAEALGYLDALDLPAPWLGKVAHGQAFRFAEVAGGRTWPDHEAVIRLLHPDGSLVALAQVDTEGWVRYRRVFKGFDLLT